MARRKQVSEPVITPEETPQEETSYKVIHENDMETLATQQPEKTTPVEEPKKEVAVPVEEEVVVDPETMKKEIAETIKKETVDKITKALTGEEGTTQAQKDRYEQIAEDFAKEKGRNPTWFELVKFIKDDIREEMKKETETERVQRETEQKQVAEENKKRGEAFNKYVDEQLDELHNLGKIDKNNKEQRNALFTAMMDVNKKRVSEGKPPIYSLKEIYYEHYKAPNAQPAGADAPISAGRGNVQPDSTEDYSYQEIRKTPFSGFFRK